MWIGTRDAKPARVKYAQVSAEVEARWANLQNGQRSLTEREAHAMARWNRITSIDSGPVHTSQSVACTRGLMVWFFILGPKIHAG